MVLSSGVLAPAFANTDAGVASESLPGASQTSGQIPLIEAALDRRLSALPGFVCHEKIMRYVQKGAGNNLLGTLDRNVEIFKDVERYSEIRWNKKPVRDMDAVPGSWSVGEMTTVLKITQDALRAGGVRTGQQSLAGEGLTTAISFAFPASARRWFIRIDSTLRWMPFEGRAWASGQSGEILRTSWHAGGLPEDSGLSDVLWTIDFKATEVSSEVMMLPDHALYQVTYATGRNRIDRNLSRFSDYRRFGASSTVHFPEEN